MDTLLQFAQTAKVMTEQTKDYVPRLKRHREQTQDSSADMENICDAWETGQPRFFKHYLFDWPFVVQWSEAIPVQNSDVFSDHVIRVLLKSAIAELNQKIDHLNRLKRSLVEKFPPYVKFAMMTSLMYDSELEQTIQINGYHDFWVCLA